MHCNNKLDPIDILDASVIEFISKRERKRRWSLGGNGGTFTRF